MKRLVLVFVAILFSFILGSCQEKIDWVLDIDVVSGNIEPSEDDETVYYEEIMSVSGRNPQGGDSWAIIFFSFLRITRL